MEATAVESGGNSGSAPATFAEAFAADASPAPDTSQQSSTPAGAETPSAEAQASPQQSDERSPFIPRARFDEVVTARKQLEEQLTGWKDYEWVRQLPAQEFREVVERIAKSKGDPIAFLQDYIGEISSHPDYGPQLRSMAARQLAAARGQQKPEGPDLSAIVVDLGNGQSLPLSAIRDQIREELLREVEPKLKTVEQITQEREQLRLQQEADSFASAFGAELTKLPGFADHKEAIAKELAAMQLTSDHPAEVKAAAYQAYAKVVVPLLGQKAESRLLDNLQQKAAASSSVNPGSAAPAAAADIRGFNDPRLSW